MENDALLLRQVHPSFIQAGNITSQVFTLPKGGSSLSVYDGEMITPDDAYNHYTKVLRNASCGVVAVSKGECESQGLSVIEDRVPYPEHISILYNSKSSKESDRIAIKLKRLATDRGWLFGPIR